jgi:hypothetical protein
MGSMIPPHSKDVTRRPEWWGEVHRGDIVELKQDTLLNAGLLTLSAYKITDTYDSTRLFKSNISVEMFKANPNGYWSDLHLLKAGTKLRLDRLERYFAPGVVSYLALYGKVLEGEQAGALAKIPARGSAYQKGSLALWPNSMVRLVPQ